MKKVLFLANHFVALYLFRRELVERLLDMNYEVYLSLPESEENRYFADRGCIIVPTQIDRRGMNLCEDVHLIAFYRKIMREIEPDVVLSYTIKPNIYGALANNGRYRQICTITGTGATFLHKSALSFLCAQLYQISTPKCSKVFFQNVEDRNYFVAHDMVKCDYDVLPGSGCNLAQYSYRPMPEGEAVRFIFIGRVMKLKGIDEYIECARRIRAKHPNAEFYVAGWIEEEHYRSILAEYHRKGYIKYVGYRRDIGDWIARCHCTILPSHGGEGVPNALLESAATGRPCIASRIAGSKDVVIDGETGFLFEAGNASSLEEKIARFLRLTPERRAAMGQAGRKKIEREFDREKIVQRYLKEIERA